MVQVQERVNEHTDSTVPEAPPPPHTHEHTNSVNRGFSDLHHGAFLFYAFGLCAIRTAVQQPLNLALARKQTCSAANSLSTLQVLRRIYRAEGHWRGLSQGVAALTLGCALSEVVYLGLFEYGRERIPIQSDISRDAVAGYLADAACRTVHIPLSIIAFRQMTTTNPMRQDPAGAVAGAAHRPQSALATLRGMYCERGLRTVFAGYGSTLVVGCQWTALWWALYGSIKSSLYSAASPLLSSTPVTTTTTTSSFSTLKQWLTAKDDNFIINSVASVTTSATTAILFNPYMVLRTNLQVTPHATLSSVTRQLWRTRGVRGFYSGLALNISACVVDGALASTSYEYAKLWSDATRYPAQPAPHVTVDTDAAAADSVLIL